MLSKKNMSPLIYIGIILIAAGLAVFWYLFFYPKANLPLGSETLTIYNSTWSVEVATTTLEQMRGLSFRESLPENQGMLFIFASGTVQNFWMKDMNFPLDMIWISGDKVVGFAQNAEPQPGAMLWSLTIYSSPDNTDKVLEVNAGTVAKDNIKVGDTVQIGI